MTLWVIPNDELRLSVGYAWWMHYTLVLCSPGMSVPRALNPSLMAFVNKDACFLKSSGLLKVTVCSLSAKEIKNSRSQRLWQ